MTERSSRIGNRSRTAASSESKSNDTGWMNTGKEIDSKAQTEREKADAKRQNSDIHRFWMKDGEEREVLVLDSSVEDCVAFYEHNLKDPTTGHYSIYEGCPKEWEHCPLCEKYGHSYYVMYMSVLDLTPFTVNKGKPTEREVPYSRKLIPIKSSIISDFRRIMDACIKEHGTMRGMILLLARDGAKSARIGKPIAIDGKSMYDFMSEAEIAEEFGHDEVKTREGKVIKKANSDLKPYDYGTTFHKPDAARLRRMYGGKPQPGSSEDNSSEWGNDVGEGDVSYDEGGEAPKTGRVSRRTRIGKPAEGVKAEPATRSRRRSAPVVNDEVGEEDPF